MDDRRKVGIIGCVVHDDIVPTLEIWIALHKSGERLNFVSTSDEAWSVRTESGETRLLARKGVGGPVDSRIIDLHKSGCYILSGIGLQPGLSGKRESGRLGATHRRGVHGKEICVGADSKSTILM